MISKKSERYSEWRSLGQVLVDSTGRWLSASVFGGSSVGASCIVIDSQDLSTTDIGDLVGEELSVFGWSNSGSELLVGASSARDDAVTLKAVSLVPSVSVRPLGPTEPLMIYSAALGNRGIFAIVEDNTLDNGRNPGLCLVHFENEGAKGKVILQLPTAVESAIRLAPDEKHILLRVCYNDSNCERIVTLNVDNGDVSYFGNETPDQEVDAYWLPEAGRFFLLTKCQGISTTRVIDLNKGSERALEAVDLFGPEHCYIQPGTSVAILARFRQGKLESAVFDISRKLLTSWPTSGDEMLPICQSPDGRWFVKVGRPNALPSLGLMALTEPQSLETLLPSKDIQRRFYEHIVQGTGISWRSSDGTTIHGFLYRATRRLTGLVVYLHGGPHSHVGISPIADIQFLVSLGFDVFAPNYRGSTGYGKEFQELLARSGGCGTGEISDILSGIEELHTMGDQYPLGITVIGGSYGGYLVWRLLTSHASHLFEAGIAINGMVDLEQDFKDSRAEIRSFMSRLMLGTPADAAEKYAKASPIHDIHRLNARLLLIKGENDRNVVGDQIEQAISRLIELGKTVEVVRVPNEGHGLNSVQAKRLVFDAIERFLGNRSGSDAGARQ